MSWSDRAERRGAKLVLFLPPEAERSQDLWHNVETHQGPMCLLWCPGIAVWKAADGQRWGAETAGSLGWNYVGLAEQPARPPPPPKRHGGKKKTWP
jgi:hypothetical protein